MSIVEDTSGVVEPSGESGGVGTNFPTNPIPPEPLRTLQMPYERAYRLATMPRKKWDERTWAAFWGAIAAAPGAWEAIHAGLKETPFKIGAFQTMQVAIFIGFTVWFIVARLAFTEKTAMEYLQELYSLPLPQKHWWQFWR